MGKVMVQGPLGLIRYDTQGGILSGMGGGPLSKITGSGSGGPFAYFNARMAAVQAAQSPADKVKAFVTTLGSRFKSGPSASTPRLPPASADSYPRFLSNLQIGSPQLVRSNFH